jgi:hypothetical protein
MQRFEYQTVYLNTKGQYQTAKGTWTDINELGVLGWELVGVVNESGELVGFFKRQLSESA